MIVKELFPRFHPELIEEINTHGIIKELPAQTELLREGQYAKVIPIVIEGLVKVYSRYGDRELIQQRVVLFLFLLASHNYLAVAMLSQRQRLHCSFYP